jgi:hypothetical protein
MAVAFHNKTPGAPRWNGTAPDSTDTYMEVALVSRRLTGG